MSNGLPLNVECTDGYHPTTTDLLLNTIEESIETWDKDDVDTLFNLAYAERDRRHEEKMNEEKR